MWSNPLNWSGDEVPVGNTQISIGNGAGTVTLDVNFTVFGTGGLKVDGFGASAPTLLVATGRTLRFENSGQIRNTVERDATIRVEGRVEVAAGSEFR